MYRRIVLTIDGIILFALIYFLWRLYVKGEDWPGLTIPMIMYLQFHMYYPLFLKLRNVSYDESSIYYNKKGYEVQIPFEEVHSIEIKSVTGIYAINLLNKVQGEKQIFFKASVWYPFNFQKRDEMVDELRDKIDQYKRSIPEDRFAGLSSYNL